MTGSTIDLTANFSPYSPPQSPTLFLETSLDSVENAERRGATVPLTKSEARVRLLSILVAESLYRCGMSRSEEITFGALMWVSQYPKMEECCNARERFKYIMKHRNLLFGPRLPLRRESMVIEAEHNDRCRCVVVTEIGESLMIGRKTIYSRHLRVNNRLKCRNCQHATLLNNGFYLRDMYSDRHRNIVKRRKHSLNSEHLRYEKVEQLFINSDLNMMSELRSRISMNVFRSPRERTGADLIRLVHQ